MKVQLFGRKAIFAAVITCAVSASAWAAQYVSDSRGARGSDYYACVHASGSAVRALEDRYPNVRILKVECRFEGGYPVPITVATAYGVID
ncbi:hypothetical protein [Bowmanella denitrificans]|uniref:hypothetical protein n=1 Tax=Bowmanella denitrificans TaxID=366582 RepID=UPI0011AF132B|nr:hypothetical protein [Bowmanella denitrificans]